MSANSASTWIGAGPREGSPESQRGTAGCSFTETSPGVFDFKGEATLTAASGEKLNSTIIGTFNAAVGHADLIYEWTGGTGRFENATGTTFWSVDVADGEYDVVANGQIIY